MKDRLRAIVAEAPGAPAARHLVREYVQHYVLYLLFRTSHYRQMAFTGGTALRVLFGLPRFSEDLDFSLAGAGQDFRFDAVCADVLSELAGAGYDVAERRRERGPVVSTLIRFPGLLHDLGLSPHAAEAMSVRLEVDTNPPAGATAGLGLVNRYHLLYSVQRYDLPTLLAGRLHAIFFRPYQKGRDVYDLLWFLTAQRETAPNLDFLNNAARQTEPDPPAFTAANWRALLAQRMAALDMPRAREEVRPFLERPEEADLMTQESFAALLAA